MKLLIFSFVLILQIVPSTARAEEHFEQPETDAGLTLCSNSRGELHVRTACQQSEVRISMQLLSLSLGVQERAKGTGRTTRSLPRNRRAQLLRELRRERVSSLGSTDVDLRSINAGRVESSQPLAGQARQGAISIPADESILYQANPLLIAAAAGAGSIDLQCLPDASEIARFGRETSAGFQSLIELRTQQTLTGFSGTEKGRGAIRLNDTVDGDAMELGFYEYGAGIFHPGLFEFWVSGLSVRQLGGSTPSYIDVRDSEDIKQLKLQHNGIDGVISTDDQPVNSGRAGAISIRPNADETWLFEQGSGNLVGNASFGGSIVFRRGQRGVRDTVDDDVRARGNNQQRATALQRTHNTVREVEAGEDAVRLPVITSENIGSHVDIFNAHAFRPTRVFPAAGDRINSRGPNEHYSLLPQKFYWCRATALRQWRCGVSA
jgi:hypothetical protein